MPVASLPAFVVVGRQGRVEEAVNLFLQGMDAQPEWPTNYLHAANLFSESRASGMTIYWGEVFRLLEPTSARSEQMASRMIAVLQEHVQVSAPDASGERQIAVSLAPRTCRRCPRTSGEHRCCRSHCHIAPALSTSRHRQRVAH